MSAQIYPMQTYKPSVAAARRFPLTNTVNTGNQLQSAITPQKAQTKPKQPSSPPLQRQNTKATPPSPPSIIRDRNGHLQFHRIGFLGEGGFARVYEVKDFRGTRVACKVVTRSSLTTKKTKTKLYAEIRIHRSLKCFEGDDNVYMILELCPSGSLMDMLRRRRRLSEAEARFFLVQIIGACHYMHMHQVIHRDLKLGNIFLDGKMNIKRKKTICGTPNYIAPEVLFDTANGHSFEVDTWSIGVILYTLVIGRPPFQTKDVKAIYKYVLRTPISPTAQELIQTILTPKPEERPALLDVIHHAFFTRGVFPPYIPTSAHDVSPDFRSITQEKEFQKAVQPGSPISALLSSAKRPLLRSTGPPGAAGQGVTKESPLFRKLQAASSSNPHNPSPLRHASGPSRPVTSQAGGRELDHILEEDDMHDELGKKRKNKTKELEAQKARIEKYETGDRNKDPVPLPESKEIKRPSVKENRLPVCANTLSIVNSSACSISEPKLQLTGFDAAAHRPAWGSSSTLPEEKIFIVSWVDYCNKYGMGYALTDGSVGVHFNDSSSIILSADKQHFDLLSSRRNGSAYVRKSFTVEQYPEDLQPKVYLLKHFERYIMDRLYGEYAYTFEDTAKTKGMAWVQNYLRMKQVIVFKLSHDVLQFNFYDHSKIILSSAGLVVTHIDKHSELTRWTLADIMRTALRPTLSTTDSEAVKFNQRLVDQLKYCKEVLVSIQSASATGGDPIPPSSTNTHHGPSGLASSVASLNARTSKALLR
ncbi:kinase-like domain-containing protein [Rhodocollybia butyracea]|uniref:Serine/threonine-protein kinase n=1 Tax=Rhodocollybia butyracea TaxID=206335 RepID=A0A9P5QBB5_9AGAR|nr:kinase-like domain-containing protein [Rhodocollybia butyracea]